MTGSKAIYIQTTTISVEFEVSFNSKSLGSQPTSDRLLRAAMSFYFCITLLDTSFTIFWYSASSASNRSFAIRASYSGD